MKINLLYGRWGLVALGLMVGVSGALWAQGEGQGQAPAAPVPPKTTAAPAPAPAGAPAADAGGMSALGRMVPAGFVNKGVVVPSLNAQGKLASVMNAETVTRLDDDRLAAGGVRIKILGQTPADALDVQLKSAVFHMAEQVVRSGEKSVVSRADVYTEGDSMVYDVQTSKGSLRGRVRTLIYDKRTQGAPAATPAPAQDAAPQPASGDRPAQSR